MDEGARDRQGRIEGMNAGIETKESSMNIKEIIDRIFKDPGTNYELTEFENLGKPMHDILSIYPQTATTDRDAGKTKKNQRGSSGQLELYPFDIRKFQVWDAPQSAQQEIRWVYQQATDSAKQSRQLLDQAKSRVEHLIDEAVQV